MWKFFRGRRAWVVLSCLVGLTVTSGCKPGEHVGAVSGSVLLEGEPYGSVAVVFFSLATGDGGSANVRGDGTFSLPSKLPVGEYRVYLAPVVPSEDVGDASPVGVKIDQAVPARYWSESTSDLVVTVQTGVNQCVIELAGDAR